MAKQSIKFENQQHFTSKCIHAGVQADPTTGALLPPIYQTTTYLQEAVGKDKGYTYSRSSNPTVSALENKLAALEETPSATCFTTGIAAISAFAFSLLKAGDHIICSDVIYGGTVRFCKEILQKFEVSASFVDTSNPKEVEAAIQENTKVILIETPANPTLKLTDISEVAKLSKKYNLTLAVDNTFLTAALLKPIDFGADVVIYSTTKYIDGHNATVGGALLAKDESLNEKFRFTRNCLGSIQTPFEAWLTLQGIKTLPLRLKQHSENALAVARYLQTHELVKKVYYPGLENFPQHELAQRQHQGAHGGIIAFELKGDIQTGIDFINSVKLCALAENLGAIETLITHPASMTHGPIPKEQREQIGIGDGLVRLSVGLEDPFDIIQDLDQAFDLVAKKHKELSE
ncbi:trans-sulfuration enzyme family protein [Fangia hongkongensis]|uniref:trans-sulfuration enzyme family protein n=1 Tax=Fangia hongkongensis TaxID=270495 RepID=UPI000370A783|nr:PLP-dependent aspartate aminotransferase family protein [Fangia hongkongensis]MBK2126361.1 PLP-dependent transferase [Fangia hongkongensis]